MLLTDGLQRLGAAPPTGWVMLLSDCQMTDVHVLLVPSVSYSQDIANCFNIGHAQIIRMTSQ